MGAPVSKTDRPKEPLTAYIAVMGCDEDGSYGASVDLKPGESIEDAMKRLWAQVPGFDKDGNPIAKERT